jgi:hypothetical protein
MAVGGRGQDDGEQAGLTEVPADVRMDEQRSKVRRRKIARGGVIRGVPVGFCGEGKKMGTRFGH